MGYGSYTNNEPHDMMEHYTDPDSMSINNMMEHSYNYNSDGLMEHYMDNDTSSMVESFIDNDLPCMSDYYDYVNNMQEEIDDGATVHKVNYPKLARGATYDPSSPRRSNMRTTMRSCYQAPSTSRWRPKEDIAKVVKHGQYSRRPKKDTKMAPNYAKL